MKNKIHDIAKAAGVSIATVSRALNNKGPMKDETRRAILQLAKEMNYQRNTLARSLSIQQTETIGLILPEVVDDFYTNIIRSIDQEAFNAKRYLMITSSHSQRDTTEALLEFLGSGRVDGVILMAPLIHDELPGLLSNTRVPVVTINTGKVAENLVSFNINNYQGAYAMTEHLIGHGYQRIGIIRGPVGNYDADERFRGYRDALLKHKMPLNQELVVQGEFTNQSGFYAFSRLMSLIEKPDAIFACNDMMALGAYEAARSLKITIPGDVALAGFDNTYLSKLVSPALTTVHVPIGELGVNALRYLLDMIAGNKSKKEGYTEEISTGLIIRESCGCNQA